MIVSHERGLVPSQAARLRGCAATLTSALLLSLWSFHGVAFAAASEPVAHDSRSTSCPEIALANALATAAPGALRQAQERVRHGDMLARDVILDYEFERFVDSRAWYTSAGMRQALVLSRQILAGVGRRDPGATLIYYRVLDTNYYADPLATTAYYAKLEGKARLLLAQKIGMTAALHKQLELRTDLQSHLASGRGLLTRAGMIWKLRRNAGAVCGAWYADRIGSAYASGIGVPRSDGDALTWYRRAASGGLIAAGYREAVIAMENFHRCGEGHGAIELLKSVARKGYVKALVLLGSAYQRGTCVRKNRKSSRRYYEQATRRGSSDGEFRLALMLAGDVYSPKGWVLGVRLLRKTLNTHVAAMWAMTGVAALYTGLCADHGHANDRRKAIALKGAANLGVVPQPDTAGTPAELHAACQAVGQEIPATFLRFERRAT